MEIYLQFHRYGVVLQASSHSTPLNQDNCKTLEKSTIVGLLSEHFIYVIVPTSKIPVLFTTCSVSNICYPGAIMTAAIQ